MSRVAGGKATALVLLNIRMLGMRRHRARAGSLGARTINLLRKPVRRDNLVEVMRAALEEHPGAMGRGLA